jgi:hypothetical protein
MTTISLKDNMKKRAGQKALPGASALKKKKSLQKRVVEFSEPRGRKVERIELITSSECHSISIRFDDKTDLSFVIDAWPRLKAEYSDWKTGNQHILKRWPVMSTGRSACATKSKPKSYLSGWHLFT